MLLNSLLKIVQKISLPLFNFLLPNFCFLCRLKPTEFGLCQDCVQELPWQSSCCPKCAQPMSANILCGPCLSDSVFYDEIIAAFCYESSIRYLITQFKFHEKLICAHLFSTLMMQALLSRHDFTVPDLLLAVPLHQARMKHRGFNQALELAKNLSRQLGVPFNRTLLCKITASLPQSGQNFKMRQKNIQGKFIMRGLVSGQHIGLVDDVVTTGSTVNEIAHLLKTHGAKRVTVFAIARTGLN